MSLKNNLPFQGQPVVNQGKLTITQAWFQFFQTLSNLLAINPFTAQPGDIKIIGGATVPTGWLLCNGASVRRVDYPDLFTAIGTVYGTVNATTFTLPTIANVATHAQYVIKT
jgi:hypothetical protein